MVWLSDKTFTASICLILVSSIHACLSATNLNPELKSCVDSLIQLSTQGSPIPVGKLFSSIKLSDSALGKNWERLLPEARKAFPELNFKSPEELHITVIYIGDWHLKDLEKIYEHALVRPNSEASLRAQSNYLGPYNEFLALELDGIPNEWKERVLQARASMTELNLRAKNPFDSSFRAHITLADVETKDSAGKPVTPSEAHLTKLKDFEIWLKQRSDFSKEVVTLGPDTKIELLVDGSQKSKGIAGFLSIEQFLNFLATKYNLPKP